jgi:hypothetical protein
MSFGIDADNLLGTLWDTLRPDRPSYFGERSRPQDGEVGLVVTLDLRMFHFGLNGEEYRRSALVHTVFTANTSVFYTTSFDFARWDQIIPESWANTSNHDSCWRTDGLRGLHLLDNTMAKEMNAEIAEHGGSALAPREFSQFCTLGALSGKPWEYVTVCHERIPGDSYKRRLLSLRSLPNKD